MTIKAFFLFYSILFWSGETTREQHNDLGVKGDISFSGNTASNQDPNWAAEREEKLGKASTAIEEYTDGLHGVSRSVPFSFDQNDGWIQKTFLRVLVLHRHHSFIWKWLCKCKCLWCFKMKGLFSRVIYSSILSGLNWCYRLHSMKVVGWGGYAEYQNSWVDQIRYIHTSIQYKSMILFLLTTLRSR